MRIRHIVVAGWMTVIPLDMALADHPSILIDATVDSVLATIPYEDADPGTWDDKMKVRVLAARSTVAAADAFLGFSSTASFGQAGQFEALITLSAAHLLRDGRSGYNDEYAEHIVYELFPNWVAAGFPHHAPPGEPDVGDCDECGLAIGELRAGWAIAFDWLYGFMEARDLQFSETNVEDNVAALITLMEMTAAQDFWDTPTKDDNNHAGVIFGGLGLVALALDGENISQSVEDDRAANLTLAELRVQNYLTKAFDPNGYGAEGTTYALLGCNVALPFAIATSGLDVSTLNVQHMATWLTRSQLPDNQFTALPLNDINAKPDDLNPPYWRSWPWLFGSASPTNPTTIASLFKTTYPPADWDTAAGFEFKPAGTIDCRSVLFSHRPIGGTLCDYKAFNSVPILLFWPDQHVGTAFLEPTDLRSGVPFSTVGAALYRDKFHDIFNRDLDGADGSTLFSFTCRNSVPWGDYGHLHGHAQHDVTHFLFYTKGVPVFYDSGYASWPASCDPATTGPLYHAPEFFSRGHNLLELEIEPFSGWTGAKYVGCTNQDGTWLNQDETERDGEFLLGLYAKGSAPFVAGGDRANQMNDGIGNGVIVTHAERHIILMPREDDSPYLFIYGDMAINPGGPSPTRPMRWLWQTAPNAVLSPGPGSSSNTLTSTMVTEGVTATTTFLYPEGQWAVDHGTVSGSWEHDYFLAELPGGYRAFSDVVAVVDVFDSGSSSTLVSTKLTTSPGDDIFAYSVANAGGMDVFCCRRADSAGEWWMEINGSIVRSDAQLVVLRSSDSSPEFLNIVAGSMVNGTRVWFDDQLVMQIDGGKGNMTFSDVEVAVSSSNAISCYYVAPVSPPDAFVNGVEETASFCEAISTTVAAFEGFETGDPSTIQLQDVGGLVSYSTVEARTGSNALDFDLTSSDTDAAYIKFERPVDGVSRYSPFDSDEVFVSFHVKPRVLPTESPESLCTIETSSGPILELRLDGAGKLHVYSNAGVDLATGDTTFSTLGYLRIDLRYHKSSQNIWTGAPLTDGSVSIRVNGNPEIELVGLALDSSTVADVRIGVPVRRSSSAVSFSIDDCVVMDGYYIGPSAGVVVTNPDADATNLDWTTTSGALFEVLMDWATGATSETSYAYSSGPSGQGSPRFEVSFGPGTAAEVPATSTIAAVMPMALMRDNLTATRARLLVAIDGVGSESAANIDAGAVYWPFQRLMNETLGGNEWTKSSLETFKVGVVDNTTTGHELRCAEVGIAVLYSDAPAAPLQGRSHVFAASGSRMIVRPNPARNRTSFALDLKTSAPVELLIFDAQGRVVRRLSSSQLAAGPHVIPWDGLNDGGGRVISGAYFYRLIVDGEASTGKIIMTR